MRYLYLLAILLPLAGCCFKKYQMLNPLQICFNKNGATNVTTATIITTYGNRATDTLRYSFTESYSTCLSFKTDNLLEGEALYITTDTPFTQTIIADFQRMDGKKCNSIPEYSYTLNGLRSDLRDEHTVTIEL